MLSQDSNTIYLPFYMSLWPDVATQRENGPAALIERDFQSFFAPLAVAHPK